VFLAEPSAERGKNAVAVPTAGLVAGRAAWEGAAMPMPLEIIGLNRPDITLVWEDEHRTTYTARELRLLCRCAHCVEEMSGRQLLDPAKVPAQLFIRGIEMVGGYAIHVSFSDGHNTGIFHFRRLREGCPCPGCERARKAAEKNRDSSDKGDKPGGKKSGPES
jgi:DUF971 family protein